MLLKSSQRNNSTWISSADAAQRKNSWGWLKTIGLGVLAALVSQVPALFACSWWRGLSPAHWAEMASDGPTVIALICVSTPIQVVLLAWLSRRVGSTALEYLALTTPGKRDLGAIVVTALILIAAGDGAAWLLGRKTITPFQVDIYRSAAAAGALPWLWLTMIAVAPIGEEVLFRGFIFKGCLQSLRQAWKAIGVTALLWASMHLQYSPPILGQVLVAGLAFGWVRWRTGSTSSTILLHAILNGAGMAETYIALSG